LDLSARRTVDDGNGLYTLVKSTTAGLGLRRRLMGRWDAHWHGDVARADTSQFASGRTDAVSGVFGLDRPLSSGATLHVSYETMHQLSRGTLPILANFDRDQVTIGIDYQFKAIPLGR
jgi:hypothetical protein